MALIIIPILLLFLFKSTRGIAWFLFGSICFMLVGVEAGVVGVAALGILIICAVAAFFRWSDKSDHVGKPRKVSPEADIKPDPYESDAHERRSKILSGALVSENIYQVGDKYGVIGPRKGTRLFKTLKGAEKYRDRVHGK